MSDKYSITTDYEDEPRTVEVDATGGIIVRLNVIDDQGELDHGPLLFNTSSAYELGLELIRLSEYETIVCRIGGCMALVPVPEYRRRDGRCDAHGGSYDE